MRLLFFVNTGGSAPSYNYLEIEFEADAGGDAP